MLPASSTAAAKKPPDRIRSPRAGPFHILAGWSMRVCTEKAIDAEKTRSRDAATETRLGASGCTGALETIASMRIWSGAKRADSENAAPDLSVPRRLFRRAIGD